MCTPLCTYISAHKILVDYHICLYVDMLVYSYIYTCIHVQVHIYAYVYVCTMHVCAHMYIYVYRYVCVYIHEWGMSMNVV